MYYWCGIGVFLFGFIFGFIVEFELCVSEVYFGDLL